MVKGFSRWFIKVVAIIILATTFINAQSGQKYIGRTLDNNSIETSDISDSSITLPKLKWLNALRIIGNPTNSYAQCKDIVISSDYFDIITGGGVDTLKPKNTGGGGGSGDVNQNGNSYGAPMTIGTNDNNQFNIETNGVSRMNITTGATSGGIFSFNPKSTVTNASVDVFSIAHTSTGTVSSNFGSNIKFTLPSSNGTIRDAGAIGFLWESAINGSEISRYRIDLRNGGTVSNHFLFTTANNGTLNVGTGNALAITRNSFLYSLNYTIGGSNTASLTLNSTATSNQNAILLSATGDGGGVTIDRGFLSNSNPIAHSLLNITGTIQSTSTGSTNYEGLKISPTFNQTGGATGKFSAIQINVPMSNSGSDFRALEIINANGHGIYQSSSTLKNKFLGNTNIGSISDAVTKLQVTAGRFGQSLGANVTIANVTTLGEDGNTFTMTGSQQLQRIVTTNWTAGSIIYLKFTSNQTVVHNSVTAGGAPILLAGSINYGAVNNSILTLLYDGTVWQEVGRKQP